MMIYDKEKIRPSLHLYSIDRQQYACEHLCAPENGCPRVHFTFS
jgi:hypothetical protein